MQSNINKITTKRDINETRIERFLNLFLIVLTILHTKQCARIAN